VICYSSRLRPALDLAARGFLWLIRTAVATTAAVATATAANPLAVLRANEGAAGDQLGRAVASSGDTAVVGAVNARNLGFESGAVYLFGRNQSGANQWGQLSRLTGSDAALGAQFGCSVALAGDTLAVGAMGDDSAQPDAGAVYVFKSSPGGPSPWLPEKKLTANDAGRGDALGAAVSLSGTALAVGSPFQTDGGVAGGAVYIFERNLGGAGQWGQVMEVRVDAPEAGDQFGLAVALAGDTLVAGANRRDGAGEDSGAAYLFRPYAATPLTMTGKVTGASTGLPGIAISGAATTASAGLVGGPKWVPGARSDSRATGPSTALGLDGSDDYVDLPNVTAGGSFTVELWVNPLATHDGQCFVGKHESNGVNVFLLGYWSGGLIAQVRDKVYTVPGKPTGWQHLAMTVAKTSATSSRVALFRNGERLGEQTLEAVLGNSAAGKPWVLGQDWDGPTQTSDFLRGQIDEVRFWEGVRTEAQLREFKDRELIGNESGLIAYYRFDEAMATGPTTRGAPPL